MQYRHLQKGGWLCIAIITQELTRYLLLSLVLVKIWGHGIPHSWTTRSITIVEYTDCSSRISRQRLNPSIKTNCKDKPLANFWVAIAPLILFGNVWKIGKVYSTFCDVREYYLLSFLFIYPILSVFDLNVWGHSSAGRAQQWHCWGQGFDPPWLHHLVISGHPVKSQNIKNIQ